LRRQETRMSQQDQTDQRTQMIRSTVVLRLPGMDEVTVEADLSYGPAVLDIYRPKDASGPLPAIVFAAGFPTPGMEAFIGCAPKAMGFAISWARLFAASGMIAVVASNVNPTADIATLFGFLRERGAGLGIDPDRLGLWA